jgi:hypothetical protein
MDIVGILANVVETEETNCWEWKRSVNRKGYGMVEFGSRTHMVHRVVYEHFVQPIPGGLQLDHLCRNHACCNPGHLEAVTGIENTRRGNTGVVNRSKTQCPKGHPYDEMNTYRDKKGRQCRACHREAMRAYKLRQIGGVLSTR